MLLIHFYLLIVKNNKYCTGACLYIVSVCVCGVGVNQLKCQVFQGRHFNNTIRLSGGRFLGNIIPEEENVPGRLCNLHPVSYEQSNSSETKKNPLIVCFLWTLFSDNEQCYRNGIFSDINDVMIWILLFVYRKVNDFYLLWISIVFYQTMLTQTFVFYSWVFITQYLTIKLCIHINYCKNIWMHFQACIY